MVNLVHYDHIEAMRDKLGYLLKAHTFMKSSILLNLLVFWKT